MKGTFATSGRNTKNSPKPTATPTSAAMDASTAAMSATWRGVAPTRRIAANRCSRRAADNRVAVAMNMSTGKSNARAPTARMIWSRFESQPSDPPLWPVAALKAVTCDAPGIFDRSAAVWPMTMINELGDGSADGPIEPICFPGKRAPRSVAGVERRSRSSAGDA